VNSLLLFDLSQDVQDKIKHKVELSSGKTTTLSAEAKERLIFFLIRDYMPVL
jgi:hypothetical protein